MAEPDPVLHPFASQIEEPVFEAEVFLCIRLIFDLEWQNLTLRENLDILCLYFHFPCGHILVDHLIRALTDQAFDCDAVFVLQSGCDILKLFLSIVVDYDLCDPVSIPKIYEVQGTVVAVSMHPAVENDSLSCVPLS